MSIPSSKVTGALIDLNTPQDDSCVPATLESLITILKERLAVQFPGQQNEFLLIISNAAPGESDRDSLWLAVDRSGAPVELRKFIKDRWTALDGWGLPWIREFFGNEDNPPTGWATCNGSLGTPDLSSTFLNIAGKTLYKAIFIGSI